jgi:biotin-(acetyl-CoA carboxylase) ligase
LALAAGHVDRDVADREGPVVAAVRARDALAARPIRWDAGAEHGTGAGIDDRGWLLVRRDDDTLLALDAGEVHLQRP